MKKFYIIFLIILGAGMMRQAYAQMLDINYKMAVPFGDEHDFIQKMSFRGISVDYYYFLTEHFAIGASVEWNTLYKHFGDETGHFLMDGEKVTITGDQFRYLNVVPILASARYYFTGENTAIRPYVGIGIGTNWTERRLEVGDLVAKEKGWQFACAPEIGIMIPFGECVGMNMGAQYRYSVNASGLPALQDLGIKVGLSLRW